MTDFNSTPQHTNLILSAYSTAISIASFFESYATKSNIAFFLGVATSCVALYAGHLTIKEKKLSIKKLQNGE